MQSNECLRETLPGVRVQTHLEGHTGALTNDLPSVPYNFFVSSSACWSVGSSTSRAQIKPQWKSLAMMDRGVSGFCRLPRAPIKLRSIMWWPMWLIRCESLEKIKRNETRRPSALFLIISRPFLSYTFVLLVKASLCTSVDKGNQLFCVFTTSFPDGLKS